MERRNMARALCCAAAFSVVGAAADVMPALASGYGQGNFDGSNQVGVVNNSISGYSPAPAITATTSAGVAKFNYAFDVHRYAGRNHVAFDQAIDLDLVLRVRHITAISGQNDPGIPTGDPKLPAAPNTCDSSHPFGPPFAECGLLTNFRDVTDESVPSATIDGAQGTEKAFHVHLDALPSDTTDADAAAQKQSLSFAIQVPECGYYEVDTGRTVPSSDDQFGNFAVLTAGYVRATPCAAAVVTTTTTSSASTTSRSTGSVSAVSTSTSSAAGAVAAVAVTPPNTGSIRDQARFLTALALVALGLVLSGMAARLRRRPDRS